jgi:hypothetical protein
VQLPRVDTPSAALLAQTQARGKADERRESVSEPASLVQLAPVARRLGDPTRDPTLDPTRQRRERGDRGDNPLDDRPRREQDTGSVSMDALERAIAPGRAGAATPVGANLSVRAFELMAQAGFDRIQSADLPSLEANGPQPLMRTGGVSGGHVHDPVNCSFCKAAILSYKKPRP